MKKTIFILISLILCCFLFYWYEIRTSSIIKSCKHETDKLYFNSQFKDSIAPARVGKLDADQENGYNREIKYREKVFLDCLRENGLNK